MIRGLILLLLCLGAQGAAYAGPHGAFDDVRACRVVGDQVYAATAGGVVRVDVAGRRVVVTDQPAHTLTADGFVAAGARAVSVHQGRRYVGTWGEGVQVDGASVVFAPTPKSPAHKRITALQVHAGKLYVGTAGQGLWRLEGEVLKRDATVPKSAWITALGTDDPLRVAPLRVATLGGEGPRGGPTSPKLVRAYAMVDGALTAVDAEHGVPGLNMAGLITLHADGAVACAGGPAGLWVRRGAWRKTPLGGAPGSDIASVAVDGDRVWVGYFNAGLAVLERGHWRTVEGVDRKVNVVAARNGKVWVGTARGLYRLGEGEPHRYTLADGLPSMDIHAIVPLADGSVLIGTGRGAAILGDGPIRLLGAKQGLPNKAVWAAGQLADGGLLLGTSQGLFRQTHLNSNRGWDRISVASGHLPDDWVTAVTVEGATAWVGTYNAGVVRLDLGDAGSTVKATKIGGGWVNFNGLTRVDDTLYAGTMDGLMRYEGGVWKREIAQDVTQVAPAGGGLWIATRNGLLPPE